jgi:D-alanyl-D-alanine carboxypeptidase
MKYQIIQFSLMSWIFLITACHSGEQSSETDVGKATLPVLEVKQPPDPDLPRLETNFTTDYIMGKFDPAVHADFTVIDPEYASREGMYMRKDTYEAFRAMHRAAQADGIRLIILSATRNFQSQKGIWEAKWTGARQVDGKDLSETIPLPEERALKILEYSSMPGTSRHHWGTDIDLNNLNNAFFEEGDGKKIYDWLLHNAAEYGFCQPYTAKGAERPHGYNEERWHWSYMPVARPLTRLAREKLGNDMITGFEGAQTAGEIDVVQKYVLGINPDCL